MTKIQVEEHLRRLETAIVLLITAVQQAAPTENQWRTAEVLRLVVAALDEPPYQERP